MQLKDHLYNQEKVKLIEGSNGLDLSTLMWKSHWDQKDLFLSKQISMSYWRQWKYDTTILAPCHIDTNFQNEFFPPKNAEGKNCVQK